MSLKIQKEKIVLNKITHSVRASQAVLQYGVGAMVDFPDQTLMTAAPEYWESQTESIHDERLEKILKVSHFCMPGNLGEAKFREGISYVRFPEWYFCPYCRDFMPISEWIKEYRNNPRCTKKAEKDPQMVKHMNCPKCGQKLVVSRIVTACECGHIDDFPWVKWVHCQSRLGRRAVCDNPKLKFMTQSSSSEGLDAIEVTCTCGARANVKNAFDKDIFQRLDEKTDYQYNFRCTGRHPWKNSEESCLEYPRTMQRGSSSVYFPYIESSLVIPPYSNMMTKAIDESLAFDKCRIAVSSVKGFGLDPDMENQLIKKQIETGAKEIALEISADENKVKDVLIRKWISDGNEEDYSTYAVKYKAEEYTALTGEVALESEDYGDFQLEKMDVNKYKIPYIKRVSLLHCLREVQAFTGFSRVNPVEGTSDGSRSANLVNIKEKETDWYPAYQVRGEGIFLEFDQTEIEEWRQNDELKKRVEVLNDNYSKSYFGKQFERTITEKYLLLHTISHLLIKQLSFECGYGIASLKERIYSSESDEGREMAGILIYTASGDSEGTLGGLVRQGRPDLFPSIFKKAMESARVCSNDPVCSLSLGQGRDSLNLAACYSCTLIPETSCESFNSFLDRGTVVGTFENSTMGFYSDYLYNGNADNKEELEKEEVESVDTDDKSSEVTLLVKSGTDLSELRYKDIWKSVEQWSSDEGEKKVLLKYADEGDLFEGCEKPESDCEFVVIGEKETYLCDLLWRKAKIMFFTTENEDDYEAAINSDWKCILCNKDISAAELVKTIKECK